ncbi:hypothetical protein ACUUYQ_13345 [Bacillus halotolerans]|uniref:hypothetical protein n=1 Tax=Bacillus halotolerans TaxID=260554 RepID=UPI004045EC93
MGKDKVDQSINWGIRQPAIYKGADGMNKKYFVVDEPYFALIKADSGEEVEKIYNEVVADTDDYENFQEEIQEVSRDQALVMYARTLDLNYKLKDVNELIKDFDKDESTFLSIDGSLA